MKLLPLLLLLAVACGRAGDPIPDLPEPAAEACTGRWIETRDGVVTLQGFESFDARGNSIESRIEAVGSEEGSSHEWSAWEVDASGVDRLVEWKLDYIGSDDVPDEVATYAYQLDERERLVWMGSESEGGSTHEETYAYDDLDQLVAMETFDNGETTGRGRYAWEDGRLVAVENVREDGSVWSSVTREYLEPPPSLDRYETWTYPEPTVLRVEADDAGNVLEQSLVDEDGGETLLERNEWDADGRQLSSLDVHPASHVQPTPSETYTTWTYGDDGRLRTERTERDEGADGVVDRVDVTEWYWWCE